MSLREADDVTEVLKNPRELTDVEWRQLCWWLRKQVIFIEDPDTTVARVALRAGIVESIGQARRTSIRVNDVIVKNPLKETIQWIDEWASIRVGKTMMNVAVVFTDIECWEILHGNRDSVRGLPEAIPGSI